MCGYQQGHRCPVICDHGNLEGFVYLSLIYFKKLLNFPPGPFSLTFTFFNVLLNVKKQSAQTSTHLLAVTHPSQDHDKHAPPSAVNFPPSVSHLPPCTADGSTPQNRQCKSRLDPEHILPTGSLNSLAPQTQHTSSKEFYEKK